MRNKREYYVFLGSTNYFMEKVTNFGDAVKHAQSFVELVKKSDASRERKMPFDEQADCLIVANNHYHSIVETAHDRLGSLIEEISTEDALIFIHNPTRVLWEYLLRQQESEEIILHCEPEKYKMDRDTKSFSHNILKISENIIGQDNAVHEVSKSMWYLTRAERKNPYVIMLYGNSGLGKTELVREIADKFYFSHYFEKHLSMFMNNTYSDYFFGEKPNRRSLGFELLERESNLIFLDEIDKCPAHFYSAFYTLFDNVLFKDATYDVDITGLLIILTSNFHNHEEMKKELGLPIFYRIDKFLKFDDFSQNIIMEITKKEVNIRKNEYSPHITSDEIYYEASKLIQTQGENARTIKYKVQEVIENMLFEEVVGNADV